jgi:tRNA_anti-like
MDALALPSTTRLAQKGNHRRCARCGKVVSSRALICRRCGKKQRVNPRTMLLLLSAVFLLLLFGFATVTQKVPFLSLLRGRDSKPAPAYSISGALLLPQQAPPAGFMTAAELWGLYNLDRPEADARFKDKPVAITGTVGDVRRDYRGNILLRLVAGDSFESVRATVVAHDRGTMTVPTRGQTVALRCTGRGALIGSPLLEGCASI